MQVIIDGEPGYKIKGVRPTIASVLAEVGEHLVAEGRGILGITADGQDIRPDRLAEVIEELGSRPIDVIEIKSESLLTMVKEILDDILTVVPELSEACHQLGEVFQGPSPNSGIQQFHQLAEIWAAIKVRQQQVAEALGLDLAGVILNSEPISKHHEELNRYLDEAADALAVMDCVLLGDLLEYELAPRAEQEVTIIMILQKFLRERAG